MDETLTYLLMLLQALSFVGIALCGIRRQMPDWVRQTSMVVNALLILCWLYFWPPRTWRGAAGDEMIFMGLGALTAGWYAWQQVHRPTRVCYLRAIANTLICVICLQIVVSIGLMNGSLIDVVYDTVRMAIRRVLAPLILGTLLLLLTNRDI